MKSNSKRIKKVIFTGLLFLVSLSLLFMSYQRLEIVKIINSKSVHQLKSHWEKASEFKKKNTISVIENSLVYLYTDYLNTGNEDNLGYIIEAANTIDETSKQSWKKELLNTAVSVNFALKYSNNKVCFETNKKKIMEIIDKVSIGLAEDLVNYSNTHYTFYWNNYVSKMNDIYDKYLLTNKSFENCPSFPTNNELKYMVASYNLAVDIYNIPDFTYNTFTNDKLKKAIKDVMNLNNDLIKEIEQDISLFEKHQLKIDLAEKINEKNKNKVKRIEKIYKLLIDL